MSGLVVVGSCCFAMALALPAYKSHGFLKISGTGWKMLWLSLVLMALGCVALFKESNEKALFYFLPGLLNLLAVSLIVLGLCSVHGPATKVLGGILFLAVTVLFPFLFLKSRGDLKSGSYFWFAACALLSASALWS
ncbi:MAG: hypothetical protein QM790_03025 [Nibricoccus sp.]